MEKKLEKLIKNFLKNFNAKEINNYFANDFCDDWDSFAIDVPKEVLEFLNDGFYIIDTQYIDDDNFEKKIKETLEKALNMIETYKKA